MSARFLWRSGIVLPVIYVASGGYPYVPHGLCLGETCWAHYLASGGRDSRRMSASFDQQCAWADRFYLPYLIASCIPAKSVFGSFFLFVVRYIPLPIIICWYEQAVELDGCRGRPLALGVRLCATNGSSRSPGERTNRSGAGWRHMIRIGTNIRSIDTDWSRRLPCRQLWRTR